MNFVDRSLTASSDLSKERCPECKGEDYEIVNNRVICKVCGLVVEKLPYYTSSNRIGGDNEIMP